MAPLDEADGDDGELLDWLWDVPERYNVGNVDDSITGELAANFALAEDDAPPGGAIRPRRPGAEKKAARQPGLAAFADGRQAGGWATEVVHPFKPGGYGGVEAVPAPMVAPKSRPSRFTARELAAGAAVLLVVLAGFGVGNAVFNSRKASKPSRVDVGTSNRSVPAIQPGAIPPIITPATTDTTASSTPPMSVAPTASSTPGSDLAGVVAGGTTSTTASTHCAGACATRPVKTTAATVTTTTRPLSTTPTAVPVTTSTTAPPSTTITTSGSTTTTSSTSTTTSTAPP